LAVWLFPFADASRLKTLEKKGIANCGTNKNSIPYDSHAVVVVDLSYRNVVAVDVFRIME
jgi:hypothetical protein